MSFQLDDFVERKLADVIGTDAAHQLITILNAIVAGSATGSQVITGTLSVSGNTTLSGDNAVGGNETVAGNEAITGTLGVTGASTLTGNVSMGGTLAVTGTSTLTGNASLGGTLSVTGAATLASSSVTGNETVGGTFGVTGALSGTTGAFSGILTFLNNQRVVTSTGTVAFATDGDGVIQDLTDNGVVTLPAITAGSKGFRVTIQNTAAAGAAKLSISPNAADAIKGTIGAVTASGTADKDWINTKATQIQGDFTTLMSDGAHTWWIVGGSGVWASES